MTGPGLSKLFEVDDLVLDTTKYCWNFFGFFWKKLFKLTQIDTIYTVKGHLLLGVLAKVLSDPINRIKQPIAMSEKILDTEIETASINVETQSQQQKIVSLFLVWYL